MNFFKKCCGTYYNKNVFLRRFKKTIRHTNAWKDHTLKISMFEINNRKYMSVKGVIYVPMLMIYIRCKNCSYNFVTLADARFRDCRKHTRISMNRLLNCQTESFGPCASYDMNVALHKIMMS